MKKFIGAPVRLFVLFLTINLFSGVFYATHQAWAADSHQPLIGAEFIAPMQQRSPLQNGVGSRGASAWMFEALGKTFELNLSSNERLVSALPVSLRQEILAQNTFLQGRMQENNESWVRLTLSAQGTSGMIWDGEQLYVVEPAAEIAERLLPAPSQSTQDDRLVIYRYDDQPKAPLICGADPNHPGPINQSYQQVISDLEAHKGSLEANAPNGVLHVVLVEDQFWSADSYAIFNVVDGIYSGHFGINISIDSSEVAQLYPASGDQLLATFKQYIGDRPRVGVSHLMSGRNDTGWAGIAYVRCLCNSWAIGVSTDHGFSSTVTIVAHEMGHNAGAEHDPGLGCGTSYIMNDYVNGSQSFSTCSTDMMAPFIASAPCIEVAPDPEPDHDGDSDVDGTDLNELAEAIQRNEINDVDGVVETFAANFGLS